MSNLSSQRELYCKLAIWNRAFWGKKSKNLWYFWVNQKPFTAGIFLIFVWNSKLFKTSNRLKMQLNLSVWERSLIMVVIRLDLLNCSKKSATRLHFYVRGMHWFLAVSRDNWFNVWKSERQRCNFIPRTLHEKNRCFQSIFTRIHSMVDKNHMFLSCKTKSSCQMRHQFSLGTGIK